MQTENDRFQDENQKSSPAERPRPPTPERRELVAEHLELGYAIAWSLLRRWRRELSHEEVASVVGLSLCEAARKYRPEYGTKFSTHFYTYLKGNLLRELGTSWPPAEVFEILSEGSDTFTNCPERRYLDRESRQIVLKAFQSMSELDREILWRSFVDQDSLIVIGKFLRCSKSSIGRMRAQAMRRLKSRVIGHHIGGKSDIEKHGKKRIRRP